MDGSSGEGEGASVRARARRQAVSAAAGRGRRRELARSPARREQRLVFVVGSPRSGTTFLGQALGGLPGFLDLGEAPPLRALLPRLAVPSAGSIAAEDVAAVRIRGVLERIRRFGFARQLRCVAQTPEMAFFVPALARAYPDVRVIHLLRDGRDVASSLLEQGWLGFARQVRGDAGLGWGSHRPLWVEPERASEFEQASEATRAAWAWRAYVTAARNPQPAGLEIRYEQMAADPTGTATLIASHLEIPAALLDRPLSRAHPRSVGRFRRELSSTQLREVEREAGGLLAELGYGRETTGV